MISFSLSLLNDHINNLLMLTLLSGPVDRTTPADTVVSLEDTSSSTKQENRSVCLFVYFSNIVKQD